MKSSKKYLSVLLIVILVLSVVSFAGGVKEQVQALIRPDLNIVLNGEKLTMTDVNGDTVHPLTYNGTTYLPARAISENLDL